MNQQVMTFHYTLTDSNGEIIDSSRGNDPLAFIQGMGQIIAGLEQHLVQMKVGDQRVIQVVAAEAYGLRDEKRVLVVPKSEMPLEKIEVGDQFRTGEDAESPILTVAEITDTHVVLDGNHPLAGLDLTFDVEIMGVREATAEETTHGHVHGEGGHHH